MFSVYNALAAVAGAMFAGVSFKDAVLALKSCSGVSGRAEVVPVNRDFTVLLDYAHTPDALENILSTVRGFTKGKLALVFGCGGDRDHGKRPLMGRIAGAMADRVYVTSDNPRTEDPMAIISQILPGFDGTGTQPKVICDRRSAILAALSEAQPGDVVVLAGKGHETYQMVGSEKLHFDEREVVAQCIQELDSGC